MSKHLAHYGTKRHSGRYPWGSGKDPYQGDPNYHSIIKRLHESGLSDEDIRENFGKDLTGDSQVPKGFHNTYNELKKTMSEVDIAKKYGVTVRELRRMRSISTNQEKLDNVNKATNMRDHGYTPTQIAKEMGVNESTVRGWLKDGFKERTETMKQTAKILDDNMKTKGGYLDISAGTERELGISKTKLDTAVKQLIDSGEYETMTVKVKQVTMPGQYTTTKILVPKGTTQKDVLSDLSQIRQVEEYTPDGGHTYWAPEYPREIARNRIAVKYFEDGGVDKDGVIEIRRGVKDLYLGDDTNYAQVRIAIEGGMYAKGMAVYSDNIPDGYDILVNTNRHVGAPDTNQGHIEGVFKEIKNPTDADLAFGAKIKANGQHHYIDDDGNEQLGYINKVNEEGDWQKWSKTLSSQFLSKQDISLIRKQLNKTYADSEEEFKSLMELTNPAVKEQLLNKFAETCDGAAVDLKACSLPRQQQHVILPVNSLRENEIYAPNYKDGEEVVLIRYPHAGTFEIPKLIVNNKNAEARAMMGANAKDAVGINHVVAETLSGADFDGDTVAVIPLSAETRIKTSPRLKGLEGFEPKEKYGYVDGMKVMQKKETGMQMGMVSNLINDMSIKGASEDEIAAAVRHSMVVIDAAKHKLNYEQSYIDNNIAALKTKYQGSPTAGASTLISRASARKDIEERQLATVDENGNLKKSWKPSEDGSLQYMPTGRTYKKYAKDKNGNLIFDENGNPKYTIKTATERHKKMEVVEDAFELSSGTAKEAEYANYANHMKALANRARKEAMSIENMEKNQAAAKIYAGEVQSLLTKLDTAEKNAPRERAAQIAANVAMKQIMNENSSMTKDEIKKISQYQMNKARAAVGANKQSVQIKIEPREWEAIQAGALSTSKQKEILKNCDLDVVRQYATPRKGSGVSVAQVNSIKNFKASGFTNAEIAERLGISTSTVSKYL